MKSSTSKNNVDFYIIKSRSINFSILKNIRYKNDCLLIKAPDKIYKHIQPCYSRQARQILFIKTKFNLTSG